jgi:hypothetical protein
LDFVIRLANLGTYQLENTPKIIPITLFPIIQLAKFFKIKLKENLVHENGSDFLTVLQGEFRNFNAE